MAPQVDVVIVVGSPNSSNSNRLREVAKKKGASAYMVDNATQIEPLWREGKKRFGVTSGASETKKQKQNKNKHKKKQKTQNKHKQEGGEEHISFPLPKGLA